jgi:hypothetical protein
MENDNLIIVLQGKIKELELDIQYNLHQHNVLQKKYDLLKEAIWALLPNHFGSDNSNKEV